MFRPLQFATALRELHKLRASTLPGLAIECLAQGVDSDSLILLADESEFSDASQLYRLFDASVQEVGLPIPSRPEALLILRDQIAGAVVSGHMKPDEGAIRLSSLYDDAKRSSTPTHKGLGLEEIVGLNDSYDELGYLEGDIAERERLSATESIDHSIFKACQALTAEGFEHHALSAQLLLGL